MTADGVLRIDTTALFARYCYRGDRHEEWVRERFETLHAQDERIPRLRHRPDSQEVHVSSLCTEEEAKTSVADNDALVRSYNRDGLNMRLDGPDGYWIVWMIADPVDRPGRDGPGSVAAHLTVRAGSSGAGKSRALGSSVITLLVNARCGVVPLDRHGRMVSSDDPGWKELRNRDNLTDEQGVLRALMSADGHRLHWLLRHALRPLGDKSCNSFRQLWIFFLTEHLGSVAERACNARTASRLRGRDGPLSAHSS